MPKHTINSVDMDHASGVIAEPRFALNWNGHSEHVQISVELNLKDLLEYIRVVEKEAPDLKSVSFYSAILSRSELNRLIKDARQARNQVYGADE